MLMTSQLIYLIMILLFFNEYVLCQCLQVSHFKCFMDEQLLMICLVIFEILFHVVFFIVRIKSTAIRKIEMENKSKQSKQNRFCIKKRNPLFSCFVFFDCAIPRVF